VDNPFAAGVADGVGNLPKPWVARGRSKRTAPGRGDADSTDDFLVKDDEGKGAASATGRYRLIRVIRDFNTAKRNRVTPRQARRVWR
jgi:hypothetical protein